MTIGLYACDGNSTSKQNDEYIHLNQDKVEVDALGGKAYINILSNCQWFISDIPNWCTIHKTEGENSLSVEIKILANNTDDPRESKIKISNGIITSFLSIIQNSSKKGDSIVWHTFPFNQIKNVSYTTGKDGKQRLYSIECTEMFINHSIKDKIFHGNLVNNQLSSYADLIDYPQYTYDPITIGAFVNRKVYVDTIYPSLSKVEKMANEIIESLPHQNSQFYYCSAPISYTSHRELNLLGIGNIGVELDKLISGYSYSEKEMSKKTGLIYSYSSVLFDIIMDIPKKNIEEEITDEQTLSSLSYINSVSYGRTSFLIVETNMEENKVKDLIQKAIERKTLNANENSIIDGLDIYYLHFDTNKKLIKEFGNSNNIINEYINSMKNADIIPLTFSVSTYPIHSIGSIIFNVNLP